MSSVPMQLIRFHYVPMMRTTFTNATIALLLILFPFVPSFAYARASLTGQSEIGTSFSGGAALGASATNTTDEVGTIVITRDSIEPASASGTSSVRAQASALAAHDATVSKVELSSSKVSLTYHEPAKLFGFIVVSVPVTVSVDATGSANVEYPWYSFLLATDRVGLGVEAQAAAQSVIGTTSGSSASTKLSGRTQVRILDALHVLLQTEAGIGNSTR